MMSKTEDIVQDYGDVGVSGRRDRRSQTHLDGSSEKSLNQLCARLEIRSLRAALPYLLTALEIQSSRACASSASRIRSRPIAAPGRAMFTIICAMAELESSLISERSDRSP